MTAQMLSNPKVSTSKSRNWIGGGNQVEKKLTADISEGALAKIVDAILYGAVPVQCYTEGELVNLKGFEIGNGKSHMLHLEGLTKGPGENDDEEDEEEKEEEELHEFGVILESKFLEFRGASIVYQPVWRRSGAPLREGIENKNLGRESSLVVSKVEFGIDYFQGGRISGLLGTAPGVVEGFIIKADASQLTCTVNAENQKGQETLPCQARVEFKALDNQLLSATGIKLTELFAKSA